MRNLCSREDGTAQSRLAFHCAVAVETNSSVDFAFDAVHSRKKSVPRAAKSHRGATLPSMSREFIVHLALSATVAVSQGKFDSVEGRRNFGSEDDSDSLPTRDR